MAKADGPSLRSNSANAFAIRGIFQALNAAYLTPNLTENGWGLTRAPEDLMVALRAGIREGVATARSEDPVEEGLQPLFADRPDLSERVSEVCDV
jgi:hypothetical protein